MKPLRKTYARCSCGGEPRPCIDWSMRLPSGGFGWYAACPACGRKTITATSAEAAKAAWNNGEASLPGKPVQEQLFVL